MRTIPVLLMAMVLAGCMDSGASDDEPGPDAGATIPAETSNGQEETPALPEPTTSGDEETPMPQVLQTEASLAFLGIQGLPIGNSNFAPDGNCVYLFLSPGTEILSGNATAAWSPQSPLIDVLRFRAYSPGDYDVRADEAGRSPLSISFGAFDQDEVWLALHSPDPAAAANQEATMQIRLEYTGEKAPRVETGPCWHPSGS